MDTMTMTTAEQISAFEAKRSASAGKMAEIMQKAAKEGRSLDDPEAQEYDGLKSEVKACDEHISRLKELEGLQVRTATPVQAKAVQTPESGAQARGGVQVPSGYVTVQPNVDKGIAFTRYVKAMVRAQFNPDLALMFAEKQASWREQTPQVLEAIRQKAAVSANAAGSAGGGSNLVYNANLAGEFIELVRPQTILGRLQGFRRVPFNIRVGSQSSGSTAYWVGEGKPIPISRLGTSEVTLGMAKAAGLVVLTKELMMSSEPAAEALVRDDLVKVNVKFIDEQFIQPDYAASANVSPASITNGVVPTAAGGTALTNVKQDVQTLIKAFITNNVPVTGLAWVMHPNLALAFTLMQNAVGQNEFPQMTLTGGTFYGLPAVASESAIQAGSPVTAEGQLLVLVNVNEILLADDGAVDVEASTEASIQMLDNPTNASSDGTATTMVSMFQTDSVALKLVRHINWAKRRSNIVQYIKDAAYAAT
jgi:HK97 family phage major capsid protein